MPFSVFTTADIVLLHLLPLFLLSHSTTGKDRNGGEGQRRQENRGRGGQSFDKTKTSLRSLFSPKRRSAATTLRLSPAVAGRGRRRPFCGGGFAEEGGETRLIVATAGRRRRPIQSPPPPSLLLEEDIKVFFLMEGGEREEEGGRGKEGWWKVSLSSVHEMENFFSPSLPFQR